MAAMMLLPLRMAHLGPPSRREHHMNATYDPQSTAAVGSLKKLGTRALLVGAVGLAVLGLGEGTANADQPTLTCPTYVVPGQTGQVATANFNLDGYQGGAVAIVSDVVSGVRLGSAQVDGFGDGSIAVTWPASWSQPSTHQLVANMQGILAPPVPGFPTPTADCTIQVDAPGSAAPAPPPAGGGATPSQPPGQCPSRPPTSCHGHGPVQYQQ
jgi:hypothetical protein